MKELDTPPPWTLTWIDALEQPEPNNRFEGRGEGRGGGIVNFDGVTSYPGNVATETGLSCTCCADN